MCDTLITPKVNTRDDGLQFKHDHFFGGGMRNFSETWVLQSKLLTLTLTYDEQDRGKNFLEEYFVVIRFSVPQSQVASQKSWKIV